MATRILLDETPGRATPVRVARCVRSPARRRTGRRPVAELEWDRPRPDALLLLVAEEPAVGLRFRYVGIDWEVDGYRDGWIARMLTEGAAS